MALRVKSPNVKSKFVWLSLSVSALGHSRVPGLHLFNLQHLIKTLGVSPLRRRFSCDLACQTFVELKPLSTPSLLTGQSWRGVVYHRNYVKSEDAQLSHGASEDDKHEKTCGVKVSPPGLISGMCKDL